MPGVVRDNNVLSDSVNERDSDTADPGLLKHEDPKQDAVEAEPVKPDAAIDQARDGDDNIINVCSVTDILVVTSLH